MLVDGVAQSGRQRRGIERSADTLHERDRGRRVSPLHGYTENVDGRAQRDRHVRALHHIRKRAHRA
eukprot:4652922-Prymnesium_polylepis.1